MAIRSLLIGQPYGVSPTRITDIYLEVPITV